MTNELEKQFFKYFGIEPRYEDACTVEDKYWDNEELANKYGTFDQYMNCKCGDQENCTTECSCAYQKEVYPEITDSILLELFDILRNYYDLDFWTIDNSFVIYGTILSSKKFANTPSLFNDSINNSSYKVKYSNPFFSALIFLTKSCL